jgi:transposase
LVLAGAVDTHAQRPRANEPAARSSEQTARQDARIPLLLVQLADQARSSDDLAFAVRAQSQAGTLLWPQDRDKARSIYRRAFNSLSTTAASKATDNTENSAATAGAAPRSGLTPAEKQQLRAELLNQIAARDLELAEELARAVADSLDVSKEACAGGAHAGGCEPGSRPAAQASDSPGPASQGNAERRELLISVALQVVERDPQRAMALGQLSLTLGVSQNFSRLLMLMRTVDAGLADLLFSSAVARLEQSQAADLAEIHLLGSYLVSSVNSSARQSVSKAVVVKYLELAFNQVTRRAELSLRSPAERASRPDESAALYFIERQLCDLFALYLPDRVAQLQQRIAEMNDSGPHSQAIDLSALPASGPAEIAHEARDASDDRERDSLNARAAMAWLSKGEVREAHASAAKISDAGIRDRVLSQVVRRYIAAGQVEDAVAVARCIDSDTSRVEALVTLSGAVLASKDRVRATELLNEAEGYSVKARPTTSRANSLLKVANSFSAFDVTRGFEVMQAAVKAINEDSARREEVKRALPPAASDGSDAGQSKTGDLYDSEFERALAVLARADFDRALLLAQQLSSKDTSVVAQIAACRGALATGSAGGQPAGDEAHVESDMNH